MRRATRRQLRPAAFLAPVVIFGGAGLALELTSVLMLSYFHPDGWGLLLPWILASLMAVTVGVVVWLGRIERGEDQVS